ncbi:MAG: hypothetical protein KBD04_02855 [Proteobacteria bacterium]|nr:hypothetical protein [Pseudomonadota bacterium]
MHYIIAFLFSILIIIKPLECCLEVQFFGEVGFEGRIVGNFTLCGDNHESIITLIDYSIIDIENLKPPLDGISRIELTQGIAKVGNTVKTAPAIFNAIYVDSNNLSTFIKSQANQLANLFRDGKHFTYEEEEYDLCNLIFKSNPNVSTEIIAEHFSAEQAQALYQIWLHRPGADFTKAEFDKAMAVISAAENKTQDGYLAELQKNFSEARALALYQNWPHRPGTDCTKTDFDKAIKLLKNAPNKIEAACLTELQKYFSFERAQALHQSWSYRPGVDFTQAEFEKAMAVISAAENKTQDGYLAELQKNFPEPRALALYQNWPHRPGADFTQAEFEKALRIMSAAEIKTQYSYLYALRRSFSRERALAIYQKSPYRPGTDFTEAEFDRAIKLLKNLPDETEAACLAEMQKYFSFKRALAIYQKSPYRPGTDFTDAELDKAIKLLKNTPNRTEDGYLAELQKYFSFKRALAIYQNSPYRPGTDFTDAELYKALRIMSAAEIKNQDGYLYALGASFSRDRALALSLYEYMLDDLKIKRKR